MNFPHFTRMLRRSAEIAEEPAMKKSVVQLYTAQLKPEAAPYVAANAALISAQSRLNAAKIAADRALEEVDAPYQEARALAAAYLPGAVLPETLKSQPTDTEKVAALGQLLEALAGHAGEPWADDQASGPFGKKAPVAVKLVQEAVDAGKALVTARNDRQSAYAPAHKAFIKFKKLVRAALGSNSPQYRRINLREDPKKATEEEETTSATPAPAPTPTPAPAQPATTTPGSPAPDDGSAIGSAATD